MPSGKSKTLRKQYNENEIQNDHRYGKLKMSLISCENLKRKEMK